MVEVYPCLKNVLKNQLHGILASLRSFESQKYYVIDEKILYQSETTVSDSFSYGYNTVFAYLKENDYGRVSQKAFNENLCISLCVSEFSYAHLPLYYEHVLGVSGTLKCLPDYIKEELQHYGIKESSLYVIPSVYGDRNKRIIQSPIYCRKEDQYQQIVANFEKEVK